MLFTVLLLAAVAPQSVYPSDPPFPSDPCAATRPIDGLLNGDFELASPCTTIGSTFECGEASFRGPYADGGFWIGAEGMTVREGAAGNRYLRVRGSARPGVQLHDFVFQRAGGEPAFAPQTELAARVRLRRRNDEARITFAEPDIAAYAFTSFVTSNLSPYNYLNYGASSSAPLNPDHPDALWEAYEEDNGSLTRMCWHYPACGVPSSVPQPMCGTSGTGQSCQTKVTNCRNFIGFFREHSPLLLCPTVTTVSSLSENASHVQAHLTQAAPVTRKVVAQFRVPKAGVVRIGMRCWRPEEYISGPQADALVEVLLERNGSTTVLRCLEVPGTDHNGLTALDRLQVLDGDRLVYKVSKLEPTKVMDLFFDPIISYEGRRLSYRVFRAGSVVPPPASVHPGERFETVIVPDNAQWHTLNLAAGADWAAHWSTPPVPPYEIELAGTALNAGPAEFDDVRAWVRYCDVETADLERQIESYFTWTREISSLLRDRGQDGYDDPAGPNPDPLDENQKGPLATPFETHVLRAQSGETVSGYGPLGAEPEDLWSRLRVDFDPADYADWSWIREAQWHRRHPTTELVYGEYDCVQDVWTGTLPGNECQETHADDWVTVFERTNDVTVLRSAAVYAEALVDYGVNQNGLPCDEALLQFAELEGCGTPPPPATASLLLIHKLEGLCSVARTYCAVERWKLEHPGSTYFDDFDTARWLSRARRGMPAFNREFNDFLAELSPFDPTCTDPSPCDASSWSSILWHNMPAALDDYFGYIAGSASVGEELQELIDWKVANALTPSADELDLSQQLRCLVDSGVTNLLPSWFECTLRCDPNTADQVRGWLYFLPRAATVAACDPSVTAGGQLVLASRYWTKFQIRGVWVNAWQQQQQLADLAGSVGLAAIPPHYYLQGFLLALAASTDPTERAELVDQLYTILRNTRLSFRDAWGLQYGFALHPVGWQNYAPNPATLISAFHQRTVDALINGVEIASWDALGMPRGAAPAVTITPPSLVPSPPQTAFAFRVRVPGETNPTALLGALTQRTEIGWWRDTGVDWEYERLWPSPPPWASFSTPLVSGDEVEFTLSVAPGFGDPFAGNEFKLDLHSWNPKGLWDRDTSYQRW